MKIEQLMTRSVRTIGLDGSLDTAAEIMWRDDCGSLPVVNENGEVVAMLTDRDICMHAWSQGRPLRELSVRGAMSSNLVVCRPADSVSAAESLMQAHQIRRLPVVDTQGHAVGLFALADLTREAILEQSRSQRELSDDDVVRTLAAVTKPRTDSRSRAIEVAQRSDSQSQRSDSQSQRSDGGRRTERSTRPTDSARRPSAGA